MIIESTMSPREFTRHALSRYFRRPGFYLYAFVCAVLTAYAIYAPSPPALLLLAAWLPFVVYCVGGWISITRRSRDTSLPVYLPTRYELTSRGVVLSSRQGRSEFGWDQFRGWRRVAGVYELTLTNGQVLVISERAVPPRQVRPFSELLAGKIKPRPEPGVFDS